MALPGTSKRNDVALWLFQYVLEIGAWRLFTGLAASPSKRGQADLFVEKLYGGWTIRRNSRGV